MTDTNTEKLTPQQQIDELRNKLNEQITQTKKENEQAVQPYKQKVAELKEQFEANRKT